MKSRLARLFLLSVLQLLLNIDNMNYIAGQQNHIFFLQLIIKLPTY